MKIDLGEILEAVGWTIAIVVMFAFVSVGVFG